MKDLIIEEKTGFTTSLPFVIFETGGQIFYSSEFTDHIEKGERLNFNLPAGSYKFNGFFQKLDKPVAMKNILLPPRERNIPRRKYQIIFGTNPNKCTIFYESGVILFDSKYKNAPLYVKYGIYYHELGHHWYKSEDKADLFAAKKMLEKGFNPSQIGRVSIDTLSSNSFSRKMKIVNWLTKNNG